MIRDKRPWMPFPIDFWMHPKIAILSDAAFRVFVEINGYSRMYDLDGRIEVTAARKRWKAKALGELLANHPERPSLSLDGDHYVIWNYDEHQLTKAARERYAEVSRENGAKGGRPRKRNPEETQLGSLSNLGGTQTKAESEVEVEDLTDITHGPESSPESDARDQNPGPIVLAAAVKNLPALRLKLEKAAGLPVSLRGAVLLIEHIHSRAVTSVGDLDAYVTAACRHPDEVRDFYDELDIGGVS